MKIEAGGALNQRNPEAGADNGAAQHRKLPGAGDIMDVEVFGEERVADQVGNEPEAQRNDDHGDGGQSVETIGQVHGIARADNDEAAEHEKKPAERNDELLEKGKGERGRERLAADCRR